MFLGYIFSQVHGKSMKDKERVKMRVLCCHTINRVFEDCNAKYFQIFHAWVHNQSNQKGRTVLDLELFSRWIEEQTQDNISKTISAINDYFYSKK